MSYPLLENRPEGELTTMIDSATIYMRWPALVHTEFLSTNHSWEWQESGIFRCLSLSRIPTMLH